MAKSMKAKIRQTAFMRFQLFWCIKHGVSLVDIVTRYEGYRAQAAENGVRPTLEGFRDDLDDLGFHGELWFCYDEFLEYDYWDVGLMRTILTPDEFKQYLEVEQIKAAEYLDGGIGLSVETPHGAIIAKPSENPDYPGISLFFHPAKDGKEGPGVVMEFNPTYHPNDLDPDHSEEKVTLLLYGKENPYDEPTMIFEMG